MFVLYVDDESRESKVHKETCHCFIGRKGNRTKSGHWVQGFSSVADAIAHALQSGKASAPCKVCHPGLWEVTK